jgi:hypothetical protein
MKLFVALLLIAGGYYLGLCKMTDMALGQLTSINQTYTNVSAASEAWSQGDTSVSLTGN